MVVDDLNKLSQVAEQVLTQVPPSVGGTVLALSGDLGSGKTSFVKILAQELGVKQTVTSPTFVLMKRYALSGRAARGWQALIHVDAYRLAGPAELAPLGWAKWLTEPATLIALEWPERVATLVPASAIKLKFIYAHSF